MARTLLSTDPGAPAWYSTLSGLVQVDDEVLEIPEGAVDGMHALVLDRVPSLPGTTDESLQIWTEEGRTGVQWDIEVWSAATHSTPPAPTTPGTVVVVPSEALVSFHPDDAATTLYASYRGVGSTWTSWDAARVQAAAQAALRFTAKPAGVALAAGTLVSVMGEEDGIPIIRKAEADTPSSMPASGFLPETIGVGETGQVVMAGEIENLMGLTPGKQIAVGTDGQVAQEGDENYPEAGDLLQEIGYAITSTRAMVNTTTRLVVL